MTHHDVLPGGGEDGEGGGLGPHHYPGPGGRAGLPGEEGGALVLGQGVGVEVVAGACQTGDGVARGGAQAALSQVEPGGGQGGPAQPRHGVRGPVQGVDLEPEVNVSPTSGED